MKLYKYRECNDYTFESLKGNYIWLSRPSSFNDTFDCQQLFDSYGDIDSNILIFCMSNSYTNPLLWGYYANGHRGICIEYELPNQFPFCFDNTSYPFFPVIKPVRYLPTFKETEKNTSFLSLEKKKELLEQYIFTKDICWSHEQEWRFAYFLERVELNSQRMSLPPNAITAIYLGCQIDKLDVEKLYKSIRHYDIDLYQCVKSNGSFSFDIKSVSKQTTWTWNNLNEREKSLAKQIDAIIFDKKIIIDITNKDEVDYIVKLIQTTPSEIEFVVDRIEVGNRCLKLIQGSDNVINSTEDLLNKIMN